jgi:hypothetical protein
MPVSHPLRQQLFEFCHLLACEETCVEVLGQLVVAGYVRGYPAKQNYRGPEHHTSPFTGMYGGNCGQQMKHLAALNIALILSVPLVVKRRKKYLARLFL